MLETTFATTFALGINVKGSAAGASWIFLLPKLEYDHIVHIGVPSTSTLATLARLGRQLTIVCRDEAQIQLVAVAGASAGAYHVAALLESDTSTLPGGGVDLIVVGAAGALRRSSVRKRLRALAQDVLTADGL